MSINLVLIGRNEGDRLVQALAAAKGQAQCLVYVDSGSTDKSVSAAQAAGAIIVELDMSQPFSAARARNAGYQAAQRHNPSTFVQFIDGDCQIVPGWLAAAERKLRADPTLAVVTGWRSEMYPDASVYNAMCDVEWHRPAGPIVACGGDMMVRAEAFDQVNGFDSTVIAAEDDEFCLRLAASGWALERLPLQMTRHDAAMTNFGQWWRRAVRAGHGFAQVGDMHAGYFSTERKRVLVFGLFLPVLAVIGAAFSTVLLSLVLLLYALSYARGVRGIRSEGLPWANSLQQAWFLLISKFPNVIGMATYALRKFRNRPPEIIEYQ